MEISVEVQMQDRIISTNTITNVRPSKLQPYTPCGFEMLFKMIKYFEALLQIFISTLLVRWKLSISSD